MCAGESIVSSLGGAASRRGRGVDRQPPTRSWRRREGRRERPPGHVRRERPRGGSAGRVRGEGLPGNAAGRVSGSVRRGTLAGRVCGEGLPGNAAGRVAGNVRRGRSAGKGPPGEPVIDAQSQLRRDRPMSRVAARWTWARCSASPQLVGLRSGASPTGLADRAALQLRDPPWRTSARLLESVANLTTELAKAELCEPPQARHVPALRRPPARVWRTRPHSRVKHLVIVKDARRVERSRWSGSRRSRHQLVR
jgi:hypothetical protein